MAVLDARDERHVVAHATRRELLDSVPDLVTHNYAVAEAFALVQNRIGMDAVRALHDEILAPVGIERVSEADHRAAVAAMLAANRRQLSLVDCVSFEAMRRLGIRRAFALDPHFTEFGFECLPDA